MFALLHNNKIKVGPRAWSYWMFRKYLEDNGLNYSELPYIYSEPIIMDVWKIIPITQLESPAYDNLFEQYAGPYWNIYDNYITGYYTVVDKTLDEIKSGLRAIVAINRYEVEIKGIDFTLNDNTIVGLYTDREDRSVYLDVLLIMNDTDTITFKFKNGIFKTVSKLELYSIVATGSSYIKDVFAWESTKCLEIDSCQSIADLKLINLKHPLQIS